MKQQNNHQRRLLLVPLIVLLVAGLACSASVDLTPEPEASATAEPSSTPEAGDSESTDEGAVEEAAQNVFIVLVTQDLNVRTGPSVNCPIIGVFPQNAQVPVDALTSDGAWWKVEVGAGEVGWMATSYTTPLTNMTEVPIEDGLACAAPTSSGPDATATQPAPTEAGVVPTVTNTVAPPTATSDGGGGIGPIITLPPLVTLPGIVVTLDPCVVLGNCPTPTTGFFVPQPILTLEPIITIDPCVLNGTCP